jgi:hypothetical protein
VQFLQRVLKLQAAVWIVFSLPELLAPKWFLVTVWRQPVYPDYAYVRSMGAAAVGLAIFMFLMAQRIEEVWFWAWGFVAVNGLLATVCALTALLGPTSGSATLYWWLLAAGNVAFAVGLIVGMNRAEAERPVS